MKGEAEAVKCPHVRVPGFTTLSHKSTTFHGRTLDPDSETRWENARGVGNAIWRMTFSYISLTSHNVYQGTSGLML